MSREIAAESEITEKEKVVCPVCSEEVDSTDAPYAKESPDGEPVHVDCWDEQYYDCYECSKTLDRDVNLPEIVNDKNICESCFDDYYFHCLDCEAADHIDDAHYTRRDDGPFCSYCVSDNEDSGMLEGAGYRPSPTYFGSHDKNKGELMFGVELEMEFSENENMVSYLEEIEERAILPISHIGKTHKSKFLYCKEDGSLNYGAEMVSHPFTWQFWKKTAKERYEKILKKLSKMGARSYETDSCGLHIHMSRNAFSRLHLYKMTRFMYNRRHRGNINKIAQRRGSSWARYQIESGDRGLFIVSKQKSDGSCQEGKYSAINVRPSNTVEIRIFKGTLSIAGLSRAIEFVHSMYWFSKNSSIKHLMWEDYCEYLKAHRNSYRNLVDMFDKKSNWTARDK